MARSTFYYHTSHEQKNQYCEIKKRIAEIYKTHKGHYGYRRITIQLREEGDVINHKTV